MNVTDEYQLPNFLDSVIKDFIRNITEVEEVHYNNVTSSYSTESDDDGSSSAASVEIAIPPPEAPRDPALPPAVPSEPESRWHYGNEDIQSSMFGNLTCIQ